MSPRRSPKLFARVIATLQVHTLAEIWVFFDRSGLASYTMHRLLKRTIFEQFFYSMLMI